MPPAWHSLPVEPHGCFTISVWTTLQTGIEVGRWRLYKQRTNLPSKKEQDMHIGSDGSLIFSSLWSWMWNMRRRERWEGGREGREENYKFVAESG